MNGKKQKNRLESILFKLKKPDPGDVLALANSNSPPSDQGISQGNSQVSNGKDSPNVSVGVKSVPEGANTNTNRRSSRKPSRREKGSCQIDGQTHDDMDKSSSSQQTDYTSKGKSVAGHAESDQVIMKEAHKGSTTKIENVQIKVEKDDAQDWPCLFSDVPFSSDEPYSQQQKGKDSSAGDLSCRKCSKKFQSLHELDKHLIVHIKQEGHNFSVHPCYICGKSFANEKYLSRHIVIHDAEAAESDKEDNTCIVEEEIQGETAQKEYFKCYRCRKMFSTDDALQLHKCKKGLVRPYGCGHCGRCYTHFTNLTNHLALHRDGLAPDLECYECGQRFMYSIELRRHVNIHIKADYTPVSISRAPVKPSSTTGTSTSVTDKTSLASTDSSAVSGSPKSLSQTLPMLRFVPGKKSKKRGPPKVNPCQVCGKIFYQRSYLTMHMKVHNEKKYMCTYCSKKFTFKKSLEIHIRSHTGEKPYHCDICNKDFTRQDSLHKHQKMHLGVKPFVCEMCGRQFGDKFELQRHSLSHSQEKPHKCTLCHKAYNDKKRLKEHMFHHSGTLPYSCDLCGKGFARKYRYHQHMSQHAGEVSFRCEMCNKGFYRRSDLNSHMETHSGKKPFRCDTCGMEFLRESYLRRHLIVHSANKPHHCSVCGKDFARKNTLRRHLLIHKRKDEEGVEDEFTEINERYNSYTTDFGYGITGSVAPLPVSNAEERDIMKDIQAVIGLGDDVDIFE